MNRWMSSSRMLNEERISARFARSRSVSPDDELVGPSKSGHDPRPLIAQGEWAGRVLTERHGHDGFGYDPVFFALEQGCAAAQLPPDVKAAASHRGQALRMLLASLG